MTIYSGFSNWKWWFSIVMLVYQRVLWSMHEMLAAVGFHRITAERWTWHESKASETGGRSGQSLSSKGNRPISSLRTLYTGKPSRNRTNRLWDSSMIIKCFCWPFFWGWLQIKLYQNLKDLFTSIPATPWAARTHGPFQRGPKSSVLTADPLIIISIYIYIYIPSG